MAFNNSENAKQQGTQYLSTAGAWSGVDGGTSGHILTSNGTGVAPSFQAGSNVGTITQFDVLVGGASSAIASVGPGTTGQVLQSSGNAANPAYSTATYPSTTSANTMLISTSANVVTTATFIASTAFTPVLTFGGSSTGITYLIQYGKYQQVGNCVTFAINLALTSKGAQTGTAVITGLPVPSENNAGGQYTFPVTFLSVGAASQQIYIAGLSANSTTLGLNYYVAGSVTVMTNANFNNTTALTLQASYFV
jgi:hypothetical protein